MLNSKLQRQLVNNLNGRSLLVTRLKGVSYIPTVGNLGPSLIKGLNKGLANLTMIKVEGGVYISGTAPTENRMVEAFIPDTQIEIIQFDNTPNV